MSIPANPRFPHYCRITRVENKGPMEDQKVEYDPMADEPDDVQNGEPDGEQEEAEETLIYEGECRAYDKNTTSDKGEVITSYRGLSIPVTREGWTEIGVVPMEGDKVVVNRGGYEEYGLVIDKNPANFGGTHLIWKYGRN